MIQIASECKEVNALLLRVVPRRVAGPAAAGNNAIPLAPDPGLSDFAIKSGFGKTGNA